MKYTVWNNFMIRTSALPYFYLKEYKESTKDIYEFISRDKYLDKFFKKALLISSKSLYYSYIHKPEGEKKYRNLCEGLLKYFIRATMRPTPYGYFANVSLGEFGEQTNLIRDKIIIDIKPDTRWANDVITSIEDDTSFLKNLLLKFNDICFISGDRMKNPYFSNRGNLKENSDIIKENSIRFTPLINLIKENTKEFIKYKNLFTIIKNEYIEIDDALIHNTIKNLLENEYLFTNIKLPAYCDDILEHINNGINCVENLEITSKSIDKLKKMFENYREDEDIDTLIDIYRLMKTLNKSKDYLEFNTGCIYKDKTLDIKLKSQIETFIDGISLITPEMKINDDLEKFKNKFLDIYGSNIEVGLTEIIDGNQFNGLSFFKRIHSPTERENKIQEIIKNKTTSATLNNREVYLTRKDFKGIDNSMLNLTKGFDLNLFISKTEDKYNLIVGPNGGSSKQGSMFQRFSGAFVEKDFRAYNEIYNEIYKRIDDKYIEVELRECTTSGRTSNVVNNNKNYKYYLPIGLVGNKENCLTIDDIKIGVAGDRDFYVKSKTLNKKLIFTKDHMLTTELNSTLYQLLYKLSQVYEDVPLNRIVCLDDSGIYSPRIYFEDVIISLKQWNFTGTVLNNDTLEGFKKDFNALINEYKIDKTVYLVESDNRLMISLSDSEDIDLLYKAFKKRRKLKLSEIEPGILKRSLVRNTQEDLFVNEFVFSLILNEDIKKPSKKDNLNIEIQNKDRIILPFQDGWIYLKLYGLENRTDEFLTRHLNILGKLGNPRWFFVRYEDDQGLHLRLRIKLKNEEEVIKNLGIINKWIRELYKINIIRKVEFDTYEREINRYGG